MPTAVEWADVLLEFLEALVHQVLYRFDVYPASSFEKRAIYGVRVHRCRHPAVCDYVRGVLQDVKEPLIRGLLQDFRILLSRDRATSIVISQQELQRDRGDEYVCTFVVRIGEMRPSEEFSPAPWEGNDIDRQQFHRILDQFRATLMRIESMKEEVMDICRDHGEEVDSLKFGVCATVFGRKAMQHVPWIFHQVHSNDYQRQQDGSVQGEEREGSKHTIPRILPIQTIMLTRKANVTCLIEFIHTKIEKQQKVD
eukprot:jgi/Picsp_1/911/NSC_04396-R1_mitotic spindle assembly checkpoint protein mad2b